MIESLIRENIKSFAPYASARSLYQAGIFFDANENALGSIVEVPGYADLNRYPDPYSLKLRKALAAFLRVSEKNVFAGNGSDEIIDLLIRLFVEPGEEQVLILDPTYGMYRVAAGIAGVDARSCALDAGYQIDLPLLESSISSKTKILFACSPNNPTGNLLRFSDIETVCRAFKGIVVVDEAYIEFASEPSLADQARDLENLIVLRTFSKAWGLAGIRVGYAIADPKVVEYLDKIKPPYNLSRVSQEIALRALENESKMRNYCALIVQERKKLGETLSEMKFRVFPSEANYLLLRYPEASLVAKRLREDFGIIVRDFSGKPALRDCIRVTVGAPEQNKLLLEALLKII